MKPQEKKDEETVFTEKTLQQMRGIAIENAAEANRYSGISHEVIETACFEALKSYARALPSHPTDKGGQFTEFVKRYPSKGELPKDMEKVFIKYRTNSTETSIDSAHWKDSEAYFIMPEGDWTNLQDVIYWLEEIESSPSDKGGVDREDAGSRTGEGVDEQYLPKDWLEYWQYKKPLKDIKDFGYAQAEKHPTVKDKGTFTLGVNAGVKEAEERLIPIIQALKSAPHIGLDKEELLRWIKRATVVNGNVSSPQLIEKILSMGLASQPKKKTINNK